MDEGMASFLEDSPDDLIIDMVRLGHEEAVFEANRRGLEIPPQGDTSADEIPEFITFDDVEIDDDTPREKLPVGLLVDAVAGGDAESARVLHERYPYLYDEAGKKIEYDEPLY